MKKFINKLVLKLIRWGRKSPNQNLVNSKNEIGTIRYAIWKMDEYWYQSDKEQPDTYWNDTLVNPLPWYLPFNIFLHKWIDSDQGLPHDHPRWTISIVLTGRLREETPKKIRWLTPGSVVFRTSKSIHKIKIPEKYKRRTYTIFIVGRRRRWQHYYENGNAYSIDDERFNNT